jgi:FMN reductase [NAD(P)H]
MNETLRLMQSHRSNRSYKPDPVSDRMLDQIVEAAYRGPTSVNSQQVSLVVVRDREKRARIAEIAGGQAWIAQAPVFITVVVDFHKTRLGVEKAGERQVAHESLEGLVAGTLDAGIALGNLMTAARSLGLGIVPIGGIRRDPQAMIELLELPPLTFPVVGVCVGHIAEEASQKPRMGMASFRHDERYRQEALPSLIAAYDETLAQHWKKIGRPDGEPWSARVAEYYQKVYFPRVKPVAAAQGFVCDK